VDEDRDHETHEDDEEEVTHERVEDAERARFRPARGARARNRLASGVQVRDVEGERRDQQDRQEQEERDRPLGLPPDRKSTRLNSSHVSISYAVFCLKKKKTHESAL